MAMTTDQSMSERLQQEGLLLRERWHSRLAGGSSPGQQGEPGWALSKAGVLDLGSAPRPS